jgi:hypothetical protein
MSPVKTPAKDNRLNPITIHKFHGFSPIRFMADDSGRRHTGRKDLAELPPLDATLCLPPTG